MDSDVVEELFVENVEICMKTRGEEVSISKLHVSRFHAKKNSIANEFA